MINPEVAIVILNYNGKKWLEKFLPSVIRTRYTSHKIIVADNASTDNSIEFIENVYPNIQIIKLKSNRGYTGGYNEALQQINSPYAVLLNSDVEVTPDWLSPLVELAEKDLNVAAIQPKILWHSQKDTFEYAGACGGFLDIYGFPFCRGRIFSNLEKDVGQYNDVCEVFWASGACLFVRMADFNSMGGLYEPFFAHMEEVDLCWRLKIKGKKIMVAPESVVYHVGGGTLGSNNPNKTYLNYRNGLMMLERNLPSSLKRKIIFQRLILDGISAVRFMHPKNWGHISAIWKAHQDYRKWKKTYIHNSLEYDIYKMKGLMNYSIVKKFFIRRQKTFSTL